jgi:hypothetical protein
VPARLVCDNLKTGVDKSDLYDPQINAPGHPLQHLIDPAQARKPKDNAATDSLWATLKVECYDRHLGPPAPSLSSPSATGSSDLQLAQAFSALGMLSPAEYKNRTTQTTKAAWPRIRQSGSSPGDTSLIHPQPLGQIVKRHQHDRIIAAHRRRPAHPGPHLPTLTMLQFHDQIRQCIDARERA